MKGGSASILVRAWCLGARLDVRELERGDVLGHGPLTVPVGASGCAMLFRFGVVVLVGLTEKEQKSFLGQLEPLIAGRFDSTEGEEVEIRILPGEAERVDADGRLVLAEASVERLQVVAHVLAKSTVLGYYERTVASAFDRVEQLLEQLRRGVSVRRGKVVVQEIGNVLSILTSTVGRAEVTEKPEITWERPDLDRLYTHLALEYELRDRDLALSRKLELVWRTAGTYLDLVNHRQVLRVEWYIVLLIVLEILLGVYEKLS